jgi:hypothetical protein
MHQCFSTRHISTAVGITELVPIPYEKSMTPIRKTHPCTIEGQKSKGPAIIIHISRVAANKTPLISYCLAWKSLHPYNTRMLPYHQCINANGSATRLWSRHTSYISTAVGITKLVPISYEKSMTPIRKTHPCTIEGPTMIRIDSAISVWWIPANNEPPVPSSIIKHGRLEVHQTMSSKTQKGTGYPTSQPLRWLVTSL